jgi:hypothetical protein
MAAMTPVWWMVAASVGGWALVSIAAGPAVGRDAAFGILGPLVSAVASWLVMHACRGDAARLNRVILQAFVVKVLFFGIYVALMLRVVSVEPVPFVVSFILAFLALHLGEAVLLQRLTGRGAAA